MQRSSAECSTSIRKTSAITSMVLTNAVTNPIPANATVTPKVLISGQSATLSVTASCAWNEAEPDGSTDASPGSAALLMVRGV